MDWHGIFGDAVLSPERWPDVLRLLAERTGSNHAQLIGLRNTSGTMFNWVNDIPAPVLDQFETAELYAPDRNFRISASLENPRPRVVHDESHYAATRARLADDQYSDLCETYDIPFGCQTLLTPDHDHVVGMALLRSRANGPTDEAVRMLFRTAAKAASDALRMSVALAHQGASLLVGALETMSRPAFLLDAMGLVQAKTPKAEELQRADVLGVRDRHLVPGRRSGIYDVDLRVEVAAALAFPANGIRTVQLDPMMVLELLPLPRRAFALPFSPHLIAVVREAPPAIARRALATQYGCTAAEAEVALLLSEGLSRQTIAQRRGVTPATVQAQIKSIYEKLDCRREAELLVRLRPLLHPG